MSEPDAETVARWRRKGFDLRYGPRWYLHKDGRPPEDDDNTYVWNKAGQFWQLYDDHEEEMELT